MTTYFLAGERTSDERIGRDVEAARRKSGLLASVTGLVAVLNENRQIVSLNQSFLSTIGISDPMPILGLRPGESLQCIHLGENPAGCGTGTYCRTCGMATVIAACMREKRPVERECALQVNRGGRIVDLFFSVRCAPLRLGNRMFFLVSLEDLTEGQRVAELQRVFFQDIDSLVSGMARMSLPMRRSKTLEIGPWTSHSYPLGLKEHVVLHDHLAGKKAYVPNLKAVAAKSILEGVQASISGRAEDEKKSVVLPKVLPKYSLKTDAMLVTRILRDMAVNALEATKAGSEVKIFSKRAGDKVVFSVWNKGAMQKDIPQRIFQRNFSTKVGAGRGLGTFSMKVFGEDLLGGRVWFTTTNAGGTQFNLALPSKQRKTARP